VDLAVCSAYKFFGPHVGALFGRRDLLEELQPYKTQAAADIVPGRWETGTLNHEGMAGLTAAVDYLAGLASSTGDRRGRIVAAMQAIGEHEAALARRFLEGLDRLPEVRLWGIRDRVEDRTPTFAIRVGDQHPLETAKALAERGVFVWDGHYYAIAVMERLGLLDSGGAVRIGFCHYNTADEVDRVLEELAALS
jgi:selenocysteine lyase/cysteine desulfurase